MRLNLAAIACCAALATGLAQAQESALEYPVKAAFLYKFGSFVEWPQDAFPSPQSPVHLCVVGRDPFGRELDNLVRGQTILTRPINVRRINVITPESGCHIAYLGGSAEQSVGAAARAVAGAAVLTVTDDRGQGDPVAIAFVIRANRVRFRIDQHAAAASGLTISSKLLNLAVEVVR